MAGPTARIHPSKRHGNPMTYKSGKPRLRGLTKERLGEMLTKTSIKKDIIKIKSEIARKERLNLK